MLRLIAVLLMFCTVGVVFADARCGASCSITKCNAPRTDTRCHHQQRPSSQQCLHQHNLTQAWTRSAAFAAIELQPANFAAQAVTEPLLDRVSPLSTLPVANVPPPGPPPMTALRI